MTCTVLNVTYRYNDHAIVYFGKIAVSTKPLNVDEFDELLDKYDVFDVFEYGEKILGIHGDYQILSTEVM